MPSIKGHEPLRIENQNDGLAVDLMMEENSCVLAINGGSSSIRFAAYGPGSVPQLIFRGKIDRIGLPGTQLTAAFAGGKPRRPAAVFAPDPHSAATRLVEWLGTHSEAYPVHAVGHRLVHGLTHTRPERVTAKLLAELRRAKAFAPDHLPGEIALLEAFGKLLPGVPQVACFDTAFHRSMPQVAKTLPIPRKWAAKGVERYGFHGLSYEFQMGELRRLGDRAAVKGRVILAHLGSGASMAAVLDGKSIDTSMGFTPAAGLVMSTRSGDLDPGVLAYLARSRGMTSPQLDRMVNHESGLLGVSGISPDMRDLLAREDRLPAAAAAIDLFCYQARKWIGSYAAVLGGLDTLVFAGGIGENASQVRNRICSGLEFLGVTVDRGRNARHEPLISRRSARVNVRVIRTDEEQVIATSVMRVLRMGKRRK